MQIKGIRLVGTGSTFELLWTGHGGPVELTVPGRYNVLVAAAATRWPSGWASKKPTSGAS